MCLYRPDARREGEFEWLKTPRITAGELQKKRFRGQKTFKKYYQTAPTSPHVVWEGFKKKKNQEKKMLSPKNNLQHIQLSDTTGTSNWTGFYGQMKLKK